MAKRTDCQAVEGGAEMKIVTTTASKTESNISITFGELETMEPLCMYQSIDQMTSRQKDIALGWINAIVNIHRPLPDIMRKVSHDDAV